MYVCTYSYMTTLRCSCFPRNCNFNYIFKRKHAECVCVQNIELQSLSLSLRAPCRKKRGKKKRRKMKENYDNSAEGTNSEICLCWYSRSAGIRKSVAFHGGFTNMDTSVQRRHVPAKRSPRFETWLGNRGNIVDRSYRVFEVLWNFRYCFRYVNMLVA